MIIRGNNLFSYYRDICKFNQELFSALRMRYDEDSIDTLCNLRGYMVDSDQAVCLDEMGVGICTLIEEEWLHRRELVEYGYTTSSGFFLLDNRYIIPVRDIEGNIVTLIGYYPDKKKYITAPTPFFSKELMFFNIDNALLMSEEYNGTVFLVEGIFDCISLRSIGLPAIATMGSTVGVSKCDLLRVFNKVVYIPDNDKTGRKALSPLGGWSVPSTAVGVKLSGSYVYAEGTEDERSVKIKDMDNLVNLYEPDDVREILLELAENYRGSVVDLTV